VQPAPVCISDSRESSAANGKEAHVMASRLVLASAVAALLLAALPSQAGIIDPVLCKERKTKAAGKKALGIMRALGKTAKQPNTARLVQDLSKAESKFTKAITKLEAGGSCVTSGDAGALEALVAKSVMDIIGQGEDGEVIIWTTQRREHPILGGVEDLKPSGQCSHRWALAEVSWTSQQLGSECRYKYQATWLCLDPYIVDTREKTGDRTGTCLFFG
jgi:hypothetical protein